MRGAFVGRARGVCGACAGRVRGCGGNKFCIIAHSALLSGHLGKSGHLPRFVQVSEFFQNSRLNKGDMIQNYFNLRLTQNGAIFEKIHFYYTFFLLESMLYKQHLNSVVRSCKATSLITFFPTLTPI